MISSIDSSEFEKLHTMLEGIKFHYKNNFSNRRGFQPHQSLIFGITRNRIEGTTGFSVSTKMYPEIWTEIQRIGKLCNPYFEFNSVFINKNVVCPPHRDSNNIGESMLVSFGNYSGCNIVIDGIEYNTKYTPIIFNGAKLEHWNTNDLIGRKYSLVFIKLKWIML